MGFMIGPIIGYFDKSPATSDFMDFPPMLNTKTAPKKITAVKTIIKPNRIIVVKNRLIILSFFNSFFFLIFLLGSTSGIASGRPGLTLFSNYMSPH